MKVNRFWVFFLSVSIFCEIKAQINLVPNPGFEEHHQCPELLSQFNGVVKNWITPTQGTPNYYNACSSQPEVGVPNNYFGFKPAFEGRAYAGIMTSNSIREYITVELKSTLKSGKIYRMRFYTSIIPTAKCRSTGLDVLLTNQLPISDLSGANLNQTPTISIPIKYTDNSWFVSTVCLMAKGGERFLTIGDLHYPNAQHSCQDGETSYYFIDEITLEEIIIEPYQEIKVATCKDQYPLILDASAFTNINTTKETEWIWDEKIHDRYLSVNQAGIYKLKLRYSSCNESDFILNVDDDNCDYALFIPNVFTPDGDGINDQFEIKTKGIELEKLTIYNRIGQTVYSSNDLEFSWNGRSGNKDSPSDVYVYVLQYTIISTNKLVQKSGSMTLIR